MQIEVLETITGVKNFVVFENQLYLVSKEGVLSWNGVVISNDIESMSVWKLYKYIFFHSIHGEFFLWDGSKIIKTISIFPNQLTSQSYMLGAINTKRVSRGVYCRDIVRIDIDSLEVAGIILENEQGKVLHYDDNYIMLLENSFLLCKSIKDGFIWSFNLIDLGKFSDWHGDEKTQIIKKLIHSDNKSIILGCDDGLIIELDLETGGLLREWQELKWHGPPSFGGVLKGKLPTSYTFEVNMRGNSMVSLTEKQFVQIDLETGNIHLDDLSETLKLNNINVLRWSTGYAQDENYIYTIGEMEPRIFGSEYTPQCIIAFNKRTKQIDWCHRFEEDSINTDIPIKEGNRLYQKSASNKLYVFEVIYPAIC